MMLKAQNWHTVIKSNDSGLLEDVALGSSFSKQIISLLSTGKDLITSVLHGNIIMKYERHHIY